MLCKKHLEERKSEIAAWQAKSKEFQGDLSRSDHPAWGVTEAQESLKWAQQQNCCVDCQAESEFLTLAEAADVFPIAYSTLAQAAREGRLRARKSGATWITTLRSIKAAIAAGRLQPNEYKEESNMEPKELIRQLETEYYAAIEANPNWKPPTLFDYLIQRGISADDIWQYSPQIGYDADKPEPDWL